MPALCLVSSSYVKTNVGHEVAPYFKEPQTMNSMPTNQVSVCMHASVQCLRMLMYVHIHQFNNKNLKFTSSWGLRLIYY